MFCCVRYVVFRSHAWRKSHENAILKIIMKMLLSNKNSNRILLIQDIVLIIINFSLKFVWVRENTKRKRERNIHYLK